MPGARTSGRGRGPSPGRPRQQALYRSLLVLYPPAFRRAYGEPMVQLFGDRLRDVGWRAWLRIAPDLLRTVPRERIEAAVTRLGPAGRVVALVLLVSSAVAMVLGRGGPPTAGLAAAVVLVAAASQRRLLAGVRRGPWAPLRRAVVQAWWAPVAGLLGLGMLVFAVGTVFEAANWGGRLVGSSLMAAFGSAMLLGLMRRPFDRAAGNLLVLLATIPALLFFWVVVPPLAAIVVWIGVLSEGFGARPELSDAH